MPNRLMRLSLLFACVLLVSASCGAPSRCHAGIHVSVVTYNIGDIFGIRQDPAFIAEILREMGTPDIVFLQEVPSEEYIEELVGALSGEVQYTAVYSRPTLAAILTVYTVTDASNATFPFAAASYGGLLAQVNVWGEEVLLTNVHLRPIRKTRDESGFVDLRFGEAASILRQEVFEETDRTRALDQVLEAIEEKGASHVILAGDFNTLPLSKTARHASRQYRDVLKGKRGYLQGTYKKIRTIVPTRVDYIYVSDAFRANKGKILKETPGDHFPIITDLCLTLEI